jgi:hypothetical protein
MSFNPGDRVRTRNDNVEGHTRLPNYLRAREGYVECSYGSFPFPDERAAGKRDAALFPLYTVRFRGEALWGGDATGISVCADLFEPYLERA